MKSHSNLSAIAEAWYELTYAPINRSRCNWYINWWSHHLQCM